MWQKPYFLDEYQMTFKQTNFLSTGKANNDNKTQSASPRSRKFSFSKGFVESGFSNLTTRNNQRFKEKIEVLDKKERLNLSRVSLKSIQYQSEEDDYRMFLTQRGNISHKKENSGNVSKCTVFYKQIK